MSIAGQCLKRVPGFLVPVLFSCAVLAAEAVRPADDAASQLVVEVGIQDYKFIPAEVRVKAGTTVKWTNLEKRTSHSVLFPLENGLESERMFPGENWSRKFTVPGTYAYRCGPHEEMKGMVHVE